MGLMKLFTALLSFNVSNLVREILKHDKVWGTICISVPTPNFGGLVPLSSSPCPAVIYAHARHYSGHEVNNVPR